MQKKNLKTSLLSAALASILVGCGGGSSNNTDVPVTGRAIDGPLSGATVTFQDCGNQTTTTDTTGNFTFPQNCKESVVIISGGVDTATDLPFVGELKAPKKVAALGQNNKVFVSPITTLIAAGGDPITIANALGLQGKDLLSIDPMEDKEVYAKTVAVQQIVEQIQKSVATLGGTTTQAQLNTQAFAALSKALTNNAPANSLTNVDTIKAAIVSTVEAVVTTLPAAIQANPSNVATNLSTLAANVISTNVKKVEDTITALPATAFNGDVAAVKTGTSAAVVTAKESVALEKIITALAPVLTTPPANIATSLTSISQAVAVPSTNSDAAITTAVGNISTSTGTAIVPDEIKQANSFYTDYLRLSSFTAQSGSYNVAQLNSSLTTPIAVANLNNLLVGVVSNGTYVNANPVNVSVGAALQLSTGSKSLTIEADQINLTFTGSTLTAAVLPAGAVVKIASNIGSVTNTTLTLANSADVYSLNQLALNATSLGRISASLATQLNNINLSGQTVSVTSILTGPHIAISNSSLANKYTVNSIQGFGVTAKFKVN